MISVTRRHGVLTELRTGPCQATVLPQHFHEDLQVILSEKRLISYRMRGAQVLSPLASVFLIEPELPHSAQVQARQKEWGPLRTFLIPRSTFSRYLGERATHSTLHFVEPILASPDLLRRLRCLHDLLTEGFDDLASESVLTASLESMLALAQRRLAVPRIRNSEVAMYRIRDLLGDTLSHSLSLSEIASSVGLSPFHVLRAFKSRFGMSPHAFRTQLRIGKARDLLLKKLPISDIAQRTGFADHAHLTRTFHRFVGVPPTRYKSAISFKTAGPGSDHDLCGENNA